MTVRAALLITMLIGLIYGSAGVLTSLTDFAVGITIACLAVIVHGCLDYVDARDDRIRRERVAERRDR